MQASIPATPSDVSTASAEQLLAGVLSLIRQIKTIDDVTPERVQAAMGQPVTTFGTGHYGFGGSLAPGWSYGLEVDRGAMQGPRLDFGFNEAGEAGTTLATPICAIDFDRFAADLEGMSFVQETIYGEHGRIIEHRFRRPGLELSVGTRGEANDPVEKISHACVIRVTVQ